MYFSFNCYKQLNPHFQENRSKHERNCRRAQVRKQIDVMCGLTFYEIHSGDDEEF